MIYAFLSALFAALTAIFAKVGLKNINPDLATAVRTVIILVLSWAVVFFKNKMEWAGRFHAQQLGVFAALRRGHGAFVAVLLQGHTGRKCI